MLNIIEITDLASPALDVFARLTEAQLRSGFEQAQGIFIAEGRGVIGLALDAGCEPVAFLATPNHIAGQAADLLARCGDISVYTADEKLLVGLTGYRLTRSVLCAMRRPPPRDPDALCADASRIAVLENIADATNVGALFRAAAALGIDAVLVTPSCCDPLNRRAVRVSMGAVFQAPWAYVCREPSQWPQPAMERLRRFGFRTVAMAPDASALSIDDPRLMAEAKLAIVLGTEGDGLAPRTIADCDYRATIPMSHGVDSLNVAAAGAIAFWQLRTRARS